MTADQLIQSLQPVGEAPTEATTDQPVEAIADIPADKFFAGLDTLSGGTVKDRETFNRVIQDAGRIGDLQQRLNAMESQAKISPFATPMVERINNMQREGRSAADIAAFVQLSTLEVDKLPALDAIQRHYQMSKSGPGWTEDLIKGQIANDLGFDLDTDEADLTIRQRARLHEKHEEAVAGLKKQQVSAENPEAVQAAQVVRQRHEQTVGGWKEVIPSLAAEHKITGKVADDVETSLNYKPSPEAISAAQAMVLQTVASNPDAFPLNKQTAEQLQGLYQQFIALTDQARRDETLFRHAYAQGMEFAMQRSSGNGSAIQRPQAQQQTIPAQSDGIPYAHLLR